MLEGCKRHHLSPLSDVPLSAHEAFLDLLEFEAWHFKVNEDNGSLSSDCSLGAKPMGNCRDLPALGWTLSLLMTPHALRWTLVPNTKPSPSW